MKQGADNWQVYHIVQPYFFAHHHFHKRKVDVLRKNGIDAKILSFIPRKLYQENIERYDSFKNNGAIELVKGGRPFFAMSLIVFLLIKILSGKKILVHVLRTSPMAIIFLRYLPFVKSRLRYIQEFEGDNASEFLYAKEYREYPRPPEKANTVVTKLKYLILLKLQRYQVNNADGLILMSQEHVDLWESRLNRSLCASILPTLADPGRVWFDPDTRKKLREELGLMGKVVLTYSGNVICKWQRREAMCRFVAELSKKQPQISFLALVRRDDITLMRSSLKNHGIEPITILKTIEQQDMYKYLSAADIALFLRHNHTMNNIVTSGKLGEYLAAGLPVITTGCNAKVLNDFIFNMIIN